MLAPSSVENNSFPQSGGKMENNNLSLANISDNFFSQCPEGESDNVLFCYFLSSQQWEQVWKYDFGKKC